MDTSRGPALGLRSRILNRIQAQADHVWTPVDFLDIGPRAALDKALQRLARTKALTRIDRGLYYLPRVNPLTGTLAVPGHAAVIDAVARRDQTRVVVDSLTAANDLGLTTAVPGRVTVLTDARLRPIQLGRQQIRFQAAAPSRLYWAGHPAMRIVQALYWLRDLLDADRGNAMRRLRRSLSDPTHGPILRADLQHGIHTLPIWMQSTVRDLLGQGADTASRARRWVAKPVRAVARSRVAPRVRP
jgi:hypothetical protein